MIELMIVVLILGIIAAIAIPNLIRLIKRSKEASVGYGDPFEGVGNPDIDQVVAYYNFVNRLANGLGVELEGYWENE